ncbi:protein IMPACT isoform X2 [Physeter macrocephalus]|uniref:Protein IMPACT n=1 Tax=Physeter macrocephalus TaxID=9755 RepID=A0A2Y9F721_PHYMC|nr:protein IMPACT isoform X2 [Physeter catodon]|eukprot:XP_007116062.1 protein IMPACT isoform X3 [Physeter catodon]
MAEGDAGSDQRQNEEIEAMAAIYGEEWCVIDDCAKIFCIRISDDIDDPKWTLCLQVMLPNEYPGTAPPIYQLNAPWLQGQERADLSNSLEEIYIQNIGESILYLWVEKIRDVLIQKSQMTEPGPDVKKKTEEEDIECEDDLILACQPENPVKALDFDVSENPTEIEELPPIDHGIPITDRRSTFQAHLAPVVCPKQVKMVLAKLYENKKISSATHNIYAYRVLLRLLPGSGAVFLLWSYGALFRLLVNTAIGCCIIIFLACEERDCEDDGETAAGGRLLHLMEILNVRNVMVVVSRWYGGILLGPDRFKHINNCARNILVEKNYTSSPEESSKTLGRNKKVRKDKKRSEH